MSTKVFDRLFECIIIGGWIVLSLLMMAALGLAIIRAMGLLL